MDWLDRTLNDPDPEAVPRDPGKAHGLKHRFQHTLFRRAELDEFEAVEARRVFEKVFALDVHGDDPLRTRDSFN